jgi:hypothetical protein
MLYSTKEKERRAAKEMLGADMHTASSYYFSVSLSSNPTKDTMVLPWKEKSNAYV